MPQLLLPSPVSPHKSPRDISPPWGLLGGLVFPCPTSGGNCVSSLTGPSPRDLLLHWALIRPWPSRRQVKWGRLWGQGQLQDPSVISPLKWVEKAGASGRSNGCVPVVVASGARPAPDGWDPCPG